MPYIFLVIAVLVRQAQSKSAKIRVLRAASCAVSLYQFAKLT
ncbi:hypothetical protein PPEP_a0515 [Pseudoalteromonas peptidolytica F12-50-A1]|uniref:Uncharacterized protein n=1 Tax=Pseudoalteromonas peptidolytica F12-50-A1 TaxID=1315280 RepID=A0A8I0MUC3_9GAMM|nr:hypothetical protein [Pseudoalteromonas peptidolytica F12-50-A1]